MATVCSADGFFELKSLTASLRRVGKDIKWALVTASEGVQDWTPFVMVLCYFVFSVSVYMVATAGVMKVFWFIYLLTNTYIASATVVEALMSIGAFHEAKKAVSKVEKKGWVFPTPDAEIGKLDIIIVAYLPNEQDIIMDRIHYLLEKIIYPREKLCVTVMYNTPMAIEPLETKMHTLTLKHSNLRVVKVPNSKSKADNVNYYCSLDSVADVSAIYDCDHYPHPYGPRWAMERFAASKDVDIVQGRCVIFNADHNLQTAMISVEFDKIYAVSHPGRSAMFDFGLFCGSNGYWKTSILKELKMDETMLTEDIDSALRAFGSGVNAVHDLNVVSFELAPTTPSAFWKQRLRWSQGWVQATFRHAHLIWCKSEVEGKTRTLAQRFGLLSLLWIRESSYYLVTQYLCLVASIIITQFPKTGEELYKLLFFQYPVAWWLFTFSIFSIFGTLYITFAVRSEFIRWWMIPVFTMTYPAQLILTAVMGLFGHARQVSKYVKWNPTPRG
ncbi:glycosyltransferase like family 2-domain-containing protein [Xylogone sp. PMI_703]|nr:glycosyltransferase like family 2-domain-containing protein [Xylogone sp. PMI_703]